MVGLRVLRDLSVPRGRPWYFCSSFGIGQDGVVHRFLVTHHYFRTLQDRQVVQGGRWYANEGVLNGAADGRHYHLRVRDRDADLRWVNLRFVVVLPGPAVNNMRHAHPVVPVNVPSDHEGDALRRRHERDQCFKQVMVVKDALTAGTNRERGRVAWDHFNEGSTAFPRRRAHLKVSNAGRVRSCDHVKAPRSGVGRNSVVHYDRARVHLVSKCQGLGVLARSVRVVVGVNRRGAFTGVQRKVRNMT